MNYPNEEQIKVLIGNHLKDLETPPTYLNPNIEKISEWIDECQFSDSDIGFINGFLFAMGKIKQLNPEPVKPERPYFPEWANYAAKDNLTDSWYLYENKPTDYDKTDDEWNFIDGKVSNDFLNTKHILWLEHINAGRPPENSLIRLENYK